MWDILYRPRRYADVIGQDGSVRLLKTRVSNGTAFDTSYIFAGGYGRGKTTLSRIHAMAMLCQDLDKRDPEPCGKCDNCSAILAEQSQAFTERDAASNGSAEAMRAIVEELPYVLANATKRIYLIDEFQRTSSTAQDVLLKPVEEKKLVVMLCTTEAEKIRGAIRSRCEEYTIKRVTREDILPRMKMILTEQNVQHDDDAVLIVIDRAEGHVRNVLNNLEMVSQLGPITVASVREYLQLSVITVYYEILLHLDEPLRAVEHLSRACELVAPDEVAAGLAEAAMNCYRMAHKCFVDFSYVDRQLAERVYTKYQDNVLRFARAFSEKKTVTRLSLELDVLSFSLRTLPAPLPAPAVVIVSQAPAVVPVPAVSQSAPPVSVSPASTLTPAAARVPQPPSHAVAAPAETPAAETAKPAPRTPDDDHEERSRLEAVACGVSMPRMRGKEYVEARTASRSKKRATIMGVPELKARLHSKLNKK